MPSATSAASPVGRSRVALSASATSFARPYRGVFPVVPTIFHADGLLRWGRNTAMGLLGIKVAHPEDIGAALDQAFAHDGPSLVEILIDPAATPIHSFRRRRESAGWRDW